MSNVWANSVLGKDLFVTPDVELKQTAGVCAVAQSGCQATDGASIPEQTVAYLMCEHFSQ